MAIEQRIFRVRRNYNKWVANQTLEDFALRFTGKAARRWSAGRVANTALGAISFLALEAIGGAILGIGLLKGGAGIRWRVLGGIGIGWVTTPVCAGLVCLVILFVLKNVFGQTVYL